MALPSPTRSFLEQNEDRWYATLFFDQHVQFWHLAADILRPLVSNSYCIRIKSVLSARATLGHQRLSNITPEPGGVRRNSRIPLGVWAKEGGSNCTQNRCTRLRPFHARPYLACVDRSGHNKFQCLREYSGKLVRQCPRSPSRLSCIRRTNYSLKWKLRTRFLSWRKERLGAQAMTTKYYTIPTK